MYPTIYIILDNIIFFVTPQFAFLFFLLLLSFMSELVLELPELVLRRAPTDGGGCDGEDGCRTPTSVEHRIAEVRSCPKAPRKRRRVAPSCKRRLTELEFFRVEPGEIESLFLNLGESEKKKKKVVEIELKD
ncbi:Cyclin-dependent protein kinase inhibitor SMR3 [Acorus calamus]|uniref:Cyclin-dependent protein kinase inhibitor SMR3 n=1 Tax=Acorus calamus TaxID=4465 RepID=A0AAV9C7L9_ACOCL|nr:Cyclin-dependent protein kinase inhibitor SMR3 [Acorus calamus]